MEELVRLFSEISPPMAVLLIAFIVIRSNNKQAEAVQANMTALITMTGRIADNTQTVENAIVAQNAAQEKFRLDIVVELSDALNEAEKLAEGSRQRMSAEMDRQLVAILAAMDALTNQLDSVAKKEDIKALNGTLTELHKISISLLEILEMLRIREKNLPKD